MIVSPYVVPGLIREVQDSYWVKSDASKHEKMMVVLTVISNYFRCPLNEMFSKNKGTRYVLVRYFAMYFLKRIVPKIRLAQIGKVIGGRHHTTVLSGIRDLTGRFIEDDGLLRKYHLELCIRLQIDANNDWKAILKEHEEDKRNGNVPEFKNKVRPVSFQKKPKIKYIVQPKNRAPIIRDMPAESFKAPFVRAAAQYSNHSPMKIASSGLD